VTRLIDGWKTGFDDVHDQPDPRRHLAEMGGLDHHIPHHGQQVFSALLARRPTTSATPPTVLGLCCSYGINAALLTCDVSLRRPGRALRLRADLPAREMVDMDRA
jgi:hypothetical protein